MSKVWIHTQDCNRRPSKFFLVLFSHDNVENYYRTSFNLMHFHKYSLTELENMIPWERAVYIDLLSTHIEIENEKIRDQQALMKAKR